MYNILLCYSSRQYLYNITSMFPLLCIHTDEVISTTKKVLEYSYIDCLKVFEHLIERFSK